MPFQTLRQGTSASFIQDLLPGSDGMYTDRTGNCTCIVFLWDYSAADKCYRSMRGMHFLGGLLLLTQPHYKDLQAAFFKDVPNVDATLMVVVGAGLHQSGDNEKPRAIAIHRKRYPKAQLVMPVAYHATIRKCGDILPNRGPPADPRNACCVIL